MNIEDFTRLINCYGASCVGFNNNVFMTRSELFKAIEELIEERDTAISELKEQARIVGMSNQRESDLQGQITRLENSKTKKAAP